MLCISEYIDTLKKNDFLFKRTEACLKSDKKAIKKNTYTHFCAYPKTTASNY